ncbi:MAG TPA: ATP-binding protein [Longimicrobiales bacterium]|nr:ATP-binding protein [Longimicrobiales bacterium]
MQRLLRLDRLERRLFGWLLLLTLLPLLTLLAGAYVVGAQSLQWVGTLGPWDRVAESGRALIEAAAPAAAADPELARALELHREELSASVLLARRWAYIGEGLAGALPLVVFTLAVILGSLALLVGRRLAVQLARPIKELAGWADAMARGQPLPAERPGEALEVREVRSLRQAMRSASVQLAQGRSRELESERVRAWGEMARRVAHEMKNPLTPLRLATHRLARHPDAETSLREPLEVIEEEVARLDELARQFAVLGRPSAGPASDVDLRELLEAMLESDVPASVDTELHVDPGVGLVRAHYDALQRAFRNLIRNAVEAMQSAPVPSVQGRHLLRVFIEARDGIVRITIGDTGCGIPPAMADRLFEPDFTLKAGGTGLGLAVVRQAVAAHGGTIHARPAGTGGAEFIMELPLNQPVPPPPTEPAGAMTDPHQDGA